MKKEVVIATRNKDKLSEILNIFADISDKFQFLSLFDFSNIPKVIEDGKTLQENAIKKAKAIAEILKMTAIAEDTGLEVEYLNGAPGIYCSTFAGNGCTYEDNNRKLLTVLKGVPSDARKAKFRCVGCIALPDGKIYTVEGAIDGYIATELRGTAGFGYDPVFIVPEYNRTFAELGAEIKNKISHRAIAFRKVKKILLKLVENCI